MQPVAKMARTVHRPNEAYLPEGIPRLSNLIGWDVRNTFILFTAVVVRCCSIALHMPQYREFSIGLKTEPAGRSILYIAYRCAACVMDAKIFELFPDSNASNLGRGLIDEWNMRRKGDLAASTRTRRLTRRCGFSGREASKEPP